jgi:hypothetical protein
MTFRPALLTVLALSLTEVGAAHAVHRREILQAMRESRGYELTATSNGARFQSEVLRRLVRRALASDPTQSPLFVDHRDWFQAYLERTGLTAAAAPAFVRLSDEFGQDMLVDYRRESVVGGETKPQPELAMNVCIWWPETTDRPGKYSYEDLLSSPRLKVTNERVISYRLMEFGDMTVFDDINGVRGRPTSGVLGFLFQLIGEGRVVETRMAISADGVQVARARARKALFEVVSTVTVYPDGHAEKDVPPARPDLAGLETRLKQPLKLPHPSVTCGGPP